MTAPAKMYDPQEPMAITLTMEQWQIVQHWLQYGADYHNCKRAEVLANCKDHRMAAQLVAEHETAAAQAETVCKIIEAAVCPAPATQTE